MVYSASGLSLRAPWQAVPPVSVKLETRLKDIFDLHEFNNN